MNSHELAMKYLLKDSILDYEDYMRDSGLDAFINPNLAEQLCHYVGVNLFTQQIHRHMFNIYSNYNLVSRKQLVSLLVYKDTDRILSELLKNRIEVLLPQSASFEPIRLSRELDNYLKYLFNISHDSILISNNYKEFDILEDILFQEYWHTEYAKYLAGPSTLVGTIDNEKRYFEFNKILKDRGMSLWRPKQLTWLLSFVLNRSSDYYDAGGNMDSYNPYVEYPPTGTFDPLSYT